MLAQNFKTAVELGITDAQLSALIKTLALMDGGKLKHTPSVDVGTPYRPFAGHFNMNQWHCGTVCCIGGTADAIAGAHLFQDHEDDWTSELNALFYPPTSAVGRGDNTYERITVEQAAIALRSYLTTGDARWDLAVAT